MKRFAAELRSEFEGNTIVGHAAVFGQMARIGSHYEQLARSAFDEVLAKDDPVFLYNHDMSNVLGRKSAGTLRLRTDEEGLAFEVDLPDTQLGRDVKELVTRGDLKDMSFGFIPGEDKWDRAADGSQINTHTSLSRLLDVSLVTFPAYEGTEARLRSFDIRPESNRSRLIRARARQLPERGM